MEKVDEGKFRLSGELTFETVQGLYSQRDTVFAGCKQVLISLDGVSHVDSAGLALMLELLRTARRHQGQLTFEHHPKQMISLIELSGLNELLAYAAA